MTLVDYFDAITTQDCSVDDAGQTLKTFSDNFYTSMKPTVYYSAKLPFDS
jgi:hypothetical protein